MEDVTESKSVDTEKPASRPAAPYERIGDADVAFGSYPKKLVTDDKIISALNAAAGELPSPSFAGDWTSYGYYIGGKRRDFMFYIDITLDGKRYRGVYFTSQRPNDTNNDGMSGGIQRGHGYVRANVYWFEYEPIMWRVAKDYGDCAKLYCSEILTARELDAAFETVYADSELRRWLLDEFFFDAFDDAERAVVIPPEDGGEDSIALLSAADNTGHFQYCVAAPSDYAKSQGLSYDENAKSFYCWIDGSGFTDAPTAAVVNKNAISFIRQSPSNTFVGVLPSIWIKLV